ncbi:MAG: hypothetical protein M1838_004124 [Thelocarpon superellum]|nr:MAG: hypothetical protein M1838_004124 [Thelocarpon superellum]
MQSQQLFHEPPPSTFQRLHHDAHSPVFQSFIELALEPPEPPREVKVVLGRWRLNIVTLGLWVALFLSALDTTIVSTALLSISNDLGQFEKSSWIVIAYLLTYTGFMLIHTKFSDIFGRKAMILTSLIVFIASSIGCASSRTMTSLIIFRAFQGLGGSGLYSNVTIIVPDMVPPARYGLYLGIVASVFAVASFLGPVLGGVIVDQTTWRWIFYMNIPTGALAFLIVTFALPNGFPKIHGTQPSSDRAWDYMKQNGARIDWPGAALSLVFSFLVLFALEEGGTTYPWTSPGIVMSLSLACLALIGFMLWQYRLGARGSSRKEALLPSRLFTRRVIGFLLLSIVMIGIPFIATIVNLPLRFQTVDGTTAQTAGIRMLPMLLTSALTSGLIAQFIWIPPCYILLLANALQTLALGLLSSLSLTVFSTQPVQYLYLAIFGAGIGTSITVALHMARLEVEERDLAVVMGASSYLRLLGGNIGVGICTAILNRTLRRQLADFLAPAEVASLLQSSAIPAGLSDRKIDMIKTAYAIGFRSQLRVMLGISVGAFLVTLWTWERNPRSAVRLAGEMR